jgi:phosphohistidine phosphatase
MYVILFRHGPAGRSDPKRWPDDRERPLSSRGEKRTRQAAEGLARALLRLGPSRIGLWTSPLVRAEQTARRLAAALAEQGQDLEPQVVAGLAPGGSMRGLLEKLSAAADEADEKEVVVVVLVGHEPDLGLLAGELALDPPAPLPLKKAGACAVWFEGAPRRRSGALEWFLSPRLLRLLAKRGKSASRQREGS